MKRLTVVFIIICASILSMFAQKNTVALGDYATTCISSALDGTQTLKVWAKGRNRTDAVMQAMKKAVWDVTFTGITVGSTNADARPLVNSMVIKDKHEDYFNSFFADNGDFLDYVTIDNQPRSAMKKYKVKGVVMMALTVVVDRSALKQKFTSDNVLQ